MPIAADTVRSASSAVADPASGPVQQSAQGDFTLQQQAEAFRALLGSGPPVKGATVTARELAHWAAGMSTAEALARAAREDPELGQGAWDNPVSSEVLLQKDSPADASADASASLQWVAAQVQASSPAVAAGGAAEAELTFAELVEKHVRRTLVMLESATSNGDEVRLELSDAVLPGTAMTLRRAPGGWQLLASTDNREALERIRQYSPALIERFARASLGSLEVLAAAARDGESNGG